MQAAELKSPGWWRKPAISLLSLLLPLGFFQTVDFLQVFELQFLDFMIGWHGERSSSPEVVLVTVDDETSRQLGSPREHLAPVIGALSRYGAKVIAVDLIFDTMNQHNAKADSELAMVTQQLGHVIHSFYFSSYLDEGSAAEKAKIQFADTAHNRFAFAPRTVMNLDFVVADSIILPHPFFLPYFPKAGIITIFYDLDEQYRRLPLLLEYHNRLYPGLALAALCEYLQVAPSRLSIQQDFWGHHLAIETPQRVIKIPVDRNGQALLDFDGPLATFKTYSMLQILKALQDIEERNAPKISLHDFAGKIVVIGSNETMGKDYFATPFTDDFPGMGMHATALSNFLSGNTLREPPWHFNVALALGLGLLLIAGSTYIGKKAKPRATVYETSLLLGLMLMYNLAAYFFLFKNLHVVPAILPINGALVLLFLATVFYEKTLNVEQLHRQVRELEGYIQEKEARLQTLDARIGAQDEQYKAIDFFIGEIESVLATPADGQPRSLETPLMKMQLFKEHLQNELEHRRGEMQNLETEKEKLRAQIMDYRRILEGNRDGTQAPPATFPPAPEKSAEKLQEANRMLESYRAFTQKTRASFNYDPAFEMVTAAANGNVRPNGHAPKSRLQEILAQIARIAPYDSTVLITGETGAGKELAAKAIHLHSKRKNGPYVELNCAAIPETLIESELFGHVRGAFTGALADRPGAFEQAHNGTIFLDEIGDLKPDLQAKLLRVLQEKKIQRLGGNKLIEVDVRVIAATHRDLQQLIQREQFRNDLYFRLDVANIHLPPLRERKEEIPHLVNYFLNRFGEKYAGFKTITDDALRALLLYDWPGNIRELQNLVERVYINTVGEGIRVADLPEKFQTEYRRLVPETVIGVEAAVASAVKAEMGNLLARCEDLLRAGHVETSLQAGELKLWGVACENCYEYMKAYVDGKASSFQPEQRDKLAKQVIVAMAEQLSAWCREQKLGSMQQSWDEIEKLLGRTRRQIGNWEREVGTPGF
jgi:transcriptional regulator with GAF, ATPase, and Fis domain/CHASE2 domain-containing sensor protein